MTIRDSERVEVLQAHECESLLNLSTKGAAFIYPHALHKNQNITMNINDTMLQGQVVYCHQRTDGYRIGAHFAIPSSDIQLAVNRMVDAFSCGVPLQFSVVPLPVL
jgi:hypothetical protein